MCAVCCSVKARAHKGPVKVVYLLGADDYNEADVPADAFVIYQVGRACQGHAGPSPWDTAAAGKADVGKLEGLTVKAHAMWQQQKQTQLIGLQTTLCKVSSVVPAPEQVLGIGHVSKASPRAVCVHAGPPW